MDSNDNPVSRPPNPSAPIMTQDEAIRRARGEDSRIPVVATLMRYGEVAEFDRALGASVVVHPERRVWVVTVHAEAEVRGGLYAPISPVVSRKAQAYSVVIDAQTGIMTDWGIGSKALEVDHLPGPKSPSAPSEGADAGPGGKATRLRRPQGHRDDPGTAQGSREPGGHGTDTQWKPRARGPSNGLPNNASGKESWEIHVRRHDRDWHVIVDRWPNGTWRWTTRRALAPDALEALRSVPDEEAEHQHEARFAEMEFGGVVKEPLPEQVLSLVVRQIDEHFSFYY